MIYVVEFRSRVREQWEIADLLRTDPAKAEQDRKRWEDAGFEAQVVPYDRCGNPGEIMRKPSDPIQCPGVANEPAC